MTPTRLIPDRANALRTGPPSQGISGAAALCGADNGGGVREAAAALRSGLGSTAAASCPSLPADHADSENCAASAAVCARAARLGASLRWALAAPLNADGHPVVPSTAEWSPLTEPFPLSAATHTARPRRPSVGVRRETGSDCGFLIGVDVGHLRAKAWGAQIAAVAAAVTAVAEEASALAAGRSPRVLAARRLPGRTFPTECASSDSASAAAAARGGFFTLELSPASMRLGIQGACLPPSDSAVRPTAATVLSVSLDEV